GGGDSELRSLRAQAGIAALGFGPSPDLLLVGDTAGHLQLWHLRRGEPVFDATEFRGRVRRAAFEASPTYVVAQTDHWLHRLAITAGGLAVQDSRLAPIGAHAEGTALATD